MGINSALFTGVSGLTTYSNAISVIGNNIANVNTTGFKESRASFADVLSTSLAATNLQVGVGVRTQSVDQLFSQGSFQTTSNPTDLAIDGDGFFVFRNPQNSGVVYGRAGDFSLDANGTLVNNQGSFVQGFDLNTASAPTSPNLTDITISSPNSPPQATTSATVHANLDADAVAPGVAFDPNNAATTSNFSTAITLHDSLGNGHTMEVYFQRQTTPASTWDWFAVANASDLTGTGIPASGRVSVARGDMTFTTSGGLDSVRTLERINYGTGALAALTPTEQAGNVTFDFAGGAATGQSVILDFGTPQLLWNGATFTANPAAPSSPSGTTQFASSSSTIFQSQNGFSSGALSSIGIDDAGIIQGSFSNGQTRNLFQIALAKFPSPGNLNQLGSGVFSESNSSGAPTIGSPRSSGLGEIVPSALELSNVDLASQFVDLIRTQQAFQANARVITTGDELLTEAVNLRR